MRKTVLTLAFFIILSLSLSGYDEKKEEKLVLTILTEREYEDQVKVARHGFNEKYDDVEVKIQTLSEEPETRETQIQKLRTQIVAGKGYDVYILNNLRYGSGEPLDELPLFDNPYKTMQSGVFSPLNDNMNQDSYWKGTSYFDPLLKAGQYEGKQYILPLSFESELFLSNTEGTGNLNGKTLLEWLEYADSSQDLDLRGTMAQQALHVKGWYQPAADYEKKAILFDEKQWADFFVLMEQFCTEYFSESVDWYGEMTVKGITNEIKRMEIVPDLQGNRIMEVQAFGAVGMSSDTKQDAYRFLMLFLNRQTEGLEDGIGGRDNPADQEAIKWMLKRSGLSDETIEETMKILSQFNLAYFSTKTESMLQTSVDQAEREKRWEVTKDWEDCKKTGAEIAEKGRRNYETQVKE